MIALGVLIGVFAKMYSRTKAQLPLGMIFFASLLFLHNVIGVYAYFTMMETVWARTVAISTWSTCCRACRHTGIAENNSAIDLIYL